MSRPNRSQPDAAPDPATLRLEPPSTAAADDPFGQLVRLVQSNEHLSRRLASLRWQQHDVQRYQERPGANQALGAAVCERLDRQVAAVRAQLQANRREAQAWLSPADVAEAPRRRLA